MIGEITAQSAARVHFKVWMTEDALAKLSNAPITNRSLTCSTASCMTAPTIWPVSLKNLLPRELNPVIQEQLAMLAPRIMP